VEDTLGALDGGGRAAALVGARSATLLAAALGYAEERHWEVVPGAWLTETDDAGPTCSCGDPDCAAPGAHPSRADWPNVATGGAARVRRLWARDPLASVLLPTGRGFDALDVPEVAGCLALARMERMDLPLGPVLCRPDRRIVFLVLPGAAVKVPPLLRRFGWPPDALDLVVRGDGDWIPAPPSRFGTAGRVRWAREPTGLNRWLPDAEALLSPLAYACGREAAARRSD
jgi:Bifunctional DNA primase/polymerase, N-terminal